MDDAAKRICRHCGTKARGYADVGGPVCHPDAGMDCYRLVTVYGHPMPCTPCSDARMLLDLQSEPWTDFASLEDSPSLAGGEDDVTFALELGMMILAGKLLRMADKLTQLQDGIVMIAPELLVKMVDDTIANNLDSPAGVEDANKAIYAFIEAHH